MRAVPETPVTPTDGVSNIHSGRGRRFSGSVKALAAFTAALLFCFCHPLISLARYAWHSELFSYVLLIPMISAYLAWQKRAAIQFTGSPRRGWGSMLLCCGGLVALGGWLTSRTSGAAQVTMSVEVLAFYICFVGACFFCLPADSLRQFAFPIGFLIFIVPFPDPLTSAIEWGLQHTSAATAQGLFVITATPVLRQGLVLQLPGISLHVAPECSGIHSTLVLFITALLAGQLFLRGPWARATLAFIVIPLGVLRNGFRIWTIGELCVHVGPQMIDSPIHHRGGPLFFLISLVPLIVVAFFLRKFELKTLNRSEAQPLS